MTKQDSNNIAWIILSAVKDIKAGKHKLAEFLKGSKAKDVAHLSGRQGYGGLLWHDIETIMGFIEQLEQMGFVKRVRTAIDEYYSVLELTEAGEKVLEEKIKIELQIIKKEKPITVGDTEKATLNLFREGKNIEEIARITDLAVSTIYDHLCRLVANDCLSTYEFIPESVIKQILEVKARLPKASKLKEIKEMLPEEITYNEIKCVLADKNLEKVEDAENSEEDDFWEEGAFIETMSSSDLKQKMRTFHMKHDEEVNYNCKKCNEKISAHNKDWHNGMCDNCFDKEVYGRK